MPLTETRKLNDTNTTVTTQQVGVGVVGVWQFDLPNGWWSINPRPEPGFLRTQILADPAGQTDGAMRIDDRYEGTGGANHQQNWSQDDH
jgi:hypothetical protein